ncbi:MAG: cytochrome c oxidase subunit [Solirubrobacterales bacterium]|nr:cytochrome c oxidase subunit [Solirubrobacterales bacterium]
MPRALEARARRVSPRVRVAVLTAGAVAFAFALLAPAAGASVLGPRAGHSPNANDIRTSYWVMLVVAIIVGLLVNGALIAVVLRYRARRDSQPARLTAGRGFFLRAAAPLGALVLALFIFGVAMTVKTETVASPGPGALQTSASETAQVGVRGVSGQALADAVSTLRNTQSAIPTAAPIKGGPLEIDAVAQQWIWRFFYPGGPIGTGAKTKYDPTNGGYAGNRTYSVDELVVPVNTPVVLNITSTDVMHRWFVPALGGQVDAVPGHVSHTWFRADKTGVFDGQSTAFSGTGYSADRMWVKVVTADQYTKFLNKQASDLGAAQAYVQKAQTSGNVPGGTP